MAPISPFGIGQVNDPALIVHRIGLIRRVTVAAASYFRKHPEPQTPEALVEHNCIVYTRLATGNEWHFSKSDGWHNSGYGQR